MSRLAAALVILLGVLIPAGAVGAASTTCDPIRGLLGPCPVPTVAGGGSGPAPTCGAETVLTPDGTDWTCTFDDEFDGQALDRSTWTVQTTADYGFHSGRECMVDSPDNVAVSGGYLDLTARDVGTPFLCQSPRISFTTHYTGASVYTSSFGQESITGLLAGSTEIDIAESYGVHPDIVVPTVHGVTLAPLLLTSCCTMPDWGADFHIYAV